MEPTRDYRLITFPDVRSARYSTRPVRSNDVHNRVVYARTRSGKFAKFHAWGTGADLNVADLTVYESSGFIELYAPPFVIRSSGFCDLESAVQTSDPNAADFEWRGSASGNATLYCPNTGIALGIDFEKLTYDAVSAAGEWSRGAVDGAHLTRQIVYIATTNVVAKALLDARGSKLWVLRFVAWSRTGAKIADASNVVLPPPFVRPPVHPLPPPAFSSQDLTDLTNLKWNGTTLKLGRGTEVSYPSYRKFSKYLPLVGDAAIRSAMQFCRPGGNAHPDLGYDYWEEPLRRQLDEDLYLFETGTPLPQSGPPPTTFMAATDSHFIDWRDARNLYLAHVAQCLWVEATQAVPWRLSRNATELSYLFDSRLLMTRSAMQYAFGIMGRVTSWSPQDAFAYLKAQGLIGGDAFGTVKNLADWARRNLVHNADQTSDPNGPFATIWDQMEWYYGYRGYPPAERMLQPPPGRAHVTFGCWGTSGFFGAVLRAVNIPVRHGRTNFAGGTHSRPEFISIGQNLAHGDDPYDRLVGVGHHTPPIDVIFYSDAELAAKIDNPVPLPGKSVPQTTSVNQMRKFGDAAIAYKTDYLLGLRCYDLTQWNQPAPPTVTWSRLWQSLHEAYSDAELTQVAADCDAATAALGGCNQIPPI